MDPAQVFGSDGDKKIKIIYIESDNLFDILKFEMLSSKQSICLLSILLYCSCKWDGKSLVKSWVYSFLKLGKITSVCLKEE